MAAHELSTPLTPLGLQVKVLQRSDPASPLGAHHANIAIIGRGHERMRSIVNQLLLAARAESAPLHNGKPADLSRIVRESTEAFLAPAQGKHVSIHADLPASAPALVDAEQVGQVVNNLLSNATKFTPPHGRISVLEPTAGGWTVTVAHTGPGLSDEQGAPALPALHAPARPTQWSGGKRPGATSAAPSSSATAAPSGPAAQGQDMAPSSDSGSRQESRPALLR